MLAEVGLPIGAAAADDAAFIKSAESAAPAAVVQHAAIHVIQASGENEDAARGSNGFLCMPDNPETPGPDPVCADANAIEWATAWIEKRESPAGKVGVMYMPAGGTDASNTDPYVAAPGPDNHWIETGPHVMIFNAMDMMEGYPVAASGGCGCAALRIGG